MKDYQPCCNSKKRVSIYNPWAQRLVKVAPYSAQAKKLYRFYIEELGFDAAWIAPPDLKFHEDSGRFTRSAEVKSKTSFKSYLSCHTISNVGRVKGFAGFDMLRQFRPVIAAALAQHGAVKVNPAAKVVMVKTLEGEVIEEVEDFYISPPIVQILNEGELDSALKTMIGSLKERTTEAELRGTGWKMRRVSTLEINCARYKPLKGSSFLELPPKLAAKKALVNVKNEDQQCFKWAVLSALFPTTANDA